LVRACAATGEAGARALARAPEVCACAEVPPSATTAKTSSPLASNAHRRRFRFDFGMFRGKLMAIRWRDSFNRRWSVP
jgi:hypothetical protein